MGLDMNLYRTKKVQDISEIKYENLFEAACWRKFNALHNWFVLNVQNYIDDCGDYIVTKEQLINLQLLLISLTEENCHDLLPTQNGFFFGSVEYDEYYWKKIKQTILIVNYLLEYVNWEKESLIYSSSW